MRPDARQLERISVLNRLPFPMTRSGVKRACLAISAGIGFLLVSFSAAVAESPATLRQVAVAPGNGNVEVQISASRPVTPQTQVIAGPDRLVIDFPNTLPGPQLHSQSINRGTVKGVRVGLFTANPPVTRVVVDLKAPQPYQIVPSGDSVIVKLNIPGTQPGTQPAIQPGSQAPERQTAAKAPTQPEESPLAHLQAAAPGHTLRPAVVRRSIHAVPATTFSVVRVPIAETSSPSALGTQGSVAGPAGNANRPDPTPILSAPYPHSGPPNTSSQQSGTVASPTIALAMPAPLAPRVPPAPRLNVDFHDGKLKIVADHATLAAVLNEVHRRTGAQITLPAGGGMEQVIVALGPAAPRDVLAALLNGSRFNFIMVGSDNDPSQVRSVLLTARSGGPSDAPAPYSPPLAAQAPPYTPPNVPQVTNNPPPPVDFSVPPADPGDMPADNTDADSAEQPSPETGGRHPRSHRPVVEEPQPNGDPTQPTEDAPQQPDQTPQ